MRYISVEVNTYPNGIVKPFAALKQLLKKIPDDQKLTFSNTRFFLKQHFYKQRQAEIK